MGGAALYAAALPRADTLLLTEIDAAVEGDVHFPPFDRSAFREVQRSEHRASAPNHFDYAFVTYQRPC